MKIYDSSDIELVKQRLKRNAAPDEKIITTVRKIIADVVREGDKALFGYTKRFDGFGLNKNNISVTREEIVQAYAETSDELIKSVRKCAANIAAFHSQNKSEGFEAGSEGAVTGTTVRPMQRAGVYVPGGKAAYPSSVLMNIIPAKIAGVEEIIMVTPPGKSGRIEPLVLVAADIAGADTILKIGGAQAVAALAYGTESVPKVDIITGPGNAYVAAAKREVFGTVGIDMIAGPSEILIIADESANPKFIAADFLSQAEHDERAASVLLTPSAKVAKEAENEIERQLKLLPRKDIAAKSLADYGTIVITDTLEQAFDIANEFAPEHLEIMVKEPMQHLEKVKNAGAVFLGEYSPEPLGDYYAGPNHVLPTAGTAKFSSPLSAETFMKRMNYINYSRKSLSACYNDIRGFAEAESLSAHARSVTVRFEEEVK